MAFQEPGRARSGALLGHGARPSPAINQPPMSSRRLMQAMAGGLAVAAGVGLLAAGGKPPSRASKLAAGGAALLAASVVADSAMEHYRGNYKKPAMHVAPIAAAITLATAVATLVSARGARVKTAIFGGAVTTGLFGLGFHVKNILERPGGLSFNNLFYRAPFGAPGALLLAGLAGIGAVDAQAADTCGTVRLRHGSGRLLGALTAFGLFGLTAEIGLLHFRGAFHNKLMYLPVSALPLNAVSIAYAVARPGCRHERQAAGWLAGTMGLAVAGTGLHAYGVSRNMGGFSNWTQNLFQGPPVAAPPSLAGIAMIGLAALDLVTPGSEPE
ncbi:hypothetical protein [Pararhizobium mangrovi]|uniref:hypothetical protein n=1 Tax=Pararhizobium mangrovi TaxID=2590452 RepID=UPI0015E83C2E|nr:hypothetical protein [Pararhizobium mangrovi]